MRRKRAIRPAGTQQRTSNGKFTQVKFFDPMLYWRQVNWLEWWEEFFNQIIPTDGTYFYKSIYQLADTKTKIQQEYDFICWFTGPASQQALDHPLNSKITAGPQDWMYKRATGGWYTEQTLKTLSKAISARMSTIERLEAVGNQITLKAVASAGSLLEKVDEAFKGMLFIPGLSFKENIDRANEYMKLRRLALKMLDSSQAIYAKSHGINFDDMGGFAQIVAASALLSQQNNPDGAQKNRFTAILEQLNKVTLLKSASYQLPLPEDMKNVVDATAEHVPDKKGKVQ